MLLGKILSHDFHTSKKSDIYIPYIEYTNYKLPVLISGSRGKFLVARRYHPDEGYGDIIKVGTFEYESHLLDVFIEDVLIAASSLAESEKWDNFARSSSPAEESFNKLCARFGDNNPAACLIPSSWSASKTQKFLGKSNVDGRKYRGTCSIHFADISSPAFLAQQEKVGVYVQFNNGSHSILIHGVKDGFMFCPDV